MLTYLLHSYEKDICQRTTHIHLENVLKSFVSTQIIPSLNLHVKEGDFVVFLGPSGCRKPTLLRLIAGLETLTAGRILIGGEDVFSNIAFPLKMAKIPKKEITEKVHPLANMLNLGEYLHRKPEQLSASAALFLASDAALASKLYLLVAL